MNSGSADG